jgi:hypothetical protein
MSAQGCRARVHFVGIDAGQSARLRILEDFQQGDGLHDDAVMGFFA